ncbi:M20/M25/M40 family metallo-hydrolase [Pseudoalteromonas sp. N1230-9]|uniref:M20/M25/M40 family metallo-hydrolase n=1 Tax=Pseudoalteromonas sp. N1230-9 TaxID=2907156 RepID=UPI002B2DD1A8|nr:M20/M25/M40 family metallo-hydrolase [Pseudoalteromonas sp. N1230-9]
MKANYRLFAPTQLSSIITSCLLLLLSDKAVANAQTFLKKDITALTSSPFYGRKTNTLGAKRAGDFISERFSELNYNVRKQHFEYDAPFNQKRSGVNIIATQKTTCTNCKMIIFTAHYDHLGPTGSRYYPGANDNASGVAALLYLAHYLAHQTQQYNLVFVATDAEENGLHGSKYLVSTLNLSDIKLSINLDMLVVNKRKPRIYAYLDRQSSSQYKKALTMLSDKELTFIVSSSSARLNRLLGTNINWRKASDHYAFAKADIPFIYFGMGDDKHHHQVTDTLEHIDFQLYEQTILKIAKFVTYLTGS